MVILLGQHVPQIAQGPETGPRAGRPSGRPLDHHPPGTHEAPDETATPGLYTRLRFWNNPCFHRGTNSTRDHKKDPSYQRIVMPAKSDGSRLS